MPIPEQRDLELARKTLSEWLAGKLPEARDLRLSEIRSPGGTGYSNETLLFDAHYTLDGETRVEGMVVRVAPTGYRLFLEADFDLQYRVMKVLDEQTAVPMPPMRWYEEDPAALGAPFYVMGRVEGRIPTDDPPYNGPGSWLSEATPEQRQRLWLSAMEAFTEIHRLDHEALGLGFLDKPHRGPTGIDQQLRYYEEYYEWARTGADNPVGDAALGWLRANLPSERPTGLSWGDARIGNMIFDDFQCRAVLDWEMVSLGGPLEDLGWWLFLDRFHSEGYGLERLPGLGSRTDTIEVWEQRTGRTARDLEFYEVFGGFRFTVIMVRLSRIFREWELMGPDDAASLERNNPVTQVLARMLELPPPA